MWANATAIVLIVRNLAGDMLQWGFHYRVAGYDVYLGEVLLTLAVILVFCYICARSKRLAWASRPSWPWSWWPAWRSAPPRRFPAGGDGASRLIMRRTERDTWGRSSPSWSWHPGRSWALRACPTPPRASNSPRKDPSGSCCWPWSPGLPAMSCWRSSPPPCCRRDTKTGAHTSRTWATWTDWPAFRCSMPSGRPWERADWRCWASR